MPNKCQAPECKYNYKTEIEMRKTQPKEKRLNLSEFPKDRERRRLWISRVPMKWTVFTLHVSLYPC